MANTQRFNIPLAIAAYFVSLVVLADNLADTAAACGACHQGSRSLATWEEEDLAKAIRGILDGKVAHPPLRLPDRGNETIAQLAALLAEGD